MSADDARAARAPAAGIEEWEPLDVLAFGVRESEALHEVAGDPAAPEGVVARYGEDPIRVPRADGVVHWREWEGGIELALVCPDQALGWPKRVQALLAAKGTGAVAIRVLLEDAELRAIDLPADERWRLVEIDLPERYAGVARLRVKLVVDPGASSLPRAARPRLSWVQLLGRVLPGTTWSALGAPEEPR